MRTADLPAQWRAEAGFLRACGAPAQADLSEKHAADLESAAREAELEELTGARMRQLTPNAEVRVGNASRGECPPFEEIAPAHAGRPCCRHSRLGHRIARYLGNPLSVTRL